MFDYSLARRRESRSDSHRATLEKICRCFRFRVSHDATPECGFSCGCQVSRWIEYDSRMSYLSGDRFFHEPNPMVADTPMVRWRLTTSAERPLWPAFSGRNNDHGAGIAWYRPRERWRGPVLCKCLSAVALRCGVGSQQDAGRSADCVSAAGKFA